MLHLRKINPMFRAIGTVGMVAGLAVGISFAAQTSNTVTLTDNSVTSTTAALQIADAACTTAPGTTTATGVTVGPLAPGDTSTPSSFCLWNAGTADLDVSVTSPTNFSTSVIPASDVTLNFTCGTTAVASVKLSALSTPTVVDSSPLAAGTGDTCTVTATLDPGVTTGGTVTPFELDFTGTSTTTTT